MTRAMLEDALGIRAEPLPHCRGGVTPPLQAPALAHLAQGLFRSGDAAVDGGGAIELIEAPDRAAEARAALRWLKARIVLDGCRPGEVALLARNIAPYRPFIQQTAAEFGLPIRLVDGLPLRENPAVAALLGLLQSALPDPTGTGRGDPAPTLPRRAVVEAWRSPYFDWSGADPSTGSGQDGAGIAPGDADDLDTIARWGRVIGGEAQWNEALDRLSELTGEPAADEKRGLPAGLPRGQAARALRDKFAHFVAWITPPAGAHSYRAFVGWLETLIGEDIPPSPRRRGAGGEVDEPASLRVVARARAGDAAASERDIAALTGLKDVLRGLVWAEEALPGGPPPDFARFVAELAGALDAASYRLPVHADREEILVGDVVQARGLPFRAAAVLGLAEGEFPATLGEDPFLRAVEPALRPDIGLVLRVSLTAGLSARSTQETPIAQLETALRMDADAVAVSVFFGRDGDIDIYRWLADLIQACEPMQMPVIAEMMPSSEQSFDAAAIAHAARIGLEIGADVIKTNYCGNVDEFAHIVQAVPLPIIVAGGPKSSPETSTLQLVRDAISGGASGVAIGRRVWQSDDPQEMTRQIHQVLFS